MAPKPVHRIDPGLTVTLALLENVESDANELCGEPTLRLTLFAPSRHLRHAVVPLFNS